jgi:ribonucleoside-diphosphate reductase alpha chain
MRGAKSGQWWESNPQRYLANNSACYTEKPEMGIFLAEWKSLYDSKSGERGIFNRISAQAKAKETGRRKHDVDFGTNPCSEIILRPREFCNLSEVVCRFDDTPETLKQKIKLAAILGTFQSTLTDFKYLSKEWRKNCEEERLLGVSLTGIMDCPVLNDPINHADLLKEMKQIAIDANKKYAKMLNINASASITCVKPSGTVSSLVDSASGLHCRHSEYYIRTVRMDNKDPLTAMMIDAGFPWEKDYVKPDYQTVFSFPIRSPENAITRESVSALEQLEFWLSVQKNWCEHKPSITISVKEDEWLEVGAWVYKHFNEISGVSFLPYSDHCYKQAPFQECSKADYEALKDKMPKNIDWAVLSKYEQQDNTVASQEFACHGNSCELI